MPFLRRVLFVAVLSLSFPSWAQDYSGGLFETHSHIEDEDEGVLEPLIERMGTHSVSAALVFSGEVFADDLEDEVEDIRNITNTYPDQLVPFFDCECESSSGLTADFVQQVIDADPGLFSGLGENALYSDPWSGEDIAPNEEPFLSVYPVLTTASLWIMFHPRQGHESALDQAATDYPNQKFLIHGYAVKDWISTILQNHSNVYLTIDTSGLLARPGNDEGNNLLYASEIDSASDFLTAYESEQNTLMQNALEIYKPIIETNPDQVLWGTDVSMSWHVDAEVYAKLLEFSRSFIGQLESSVQEKYALANARSLFTAVAAQEGSGDDDDAGDSGGGCSLILSLSAHEGQPYPVPPTIAAPIETTTLKKNSELFSREVLPIFRQKCFDCHSSQTHYPWYYRLPVAGQIMDRDIREGRKHVDMTNGFPFEGHHSVVEQLEALEKVIGKDSMPLWRYRLLHPGSGLTEQEKKVILDWVGSARRGLLFNGK